MEQRLIDATALKAEFDPNDKIEFDPIGVRYYIENAPTIDPLHALGACYCRECKHSRNWSNGLCYKNTEPCDNAKGYKGTVVCVEKTDFCSYGIPKENSLPNR